MAGRLNFGVTMDRELVAWVDSARGPSSRSRFIELAVTTLRNLLEGEEPDGPAPAAAAVERIPFPTGGQLP